MPVPAVAEAAGRPEPALSVDRPPEDGEEGDEDGPTGARALVRARSAPSGAPGGGSMLGLRRTLDQRHDPERHDLGVAVVVEIAPSITASCVRQTEQAMRVKSPGPSPSRLAE